MKPANAKPCRYATSIVVRVHPAEREELNRLAAARGESLQVFTRQRLGLEARAPAATQGRNAHHDQAET